MRRAGRWRTRLRRAFIALALASAFCVAYGYFVSQAEAGVEELPTGALSLFLYHFPYPDVLRETDWERVDLFCAGHTHGGQVALPFYGAIMTLSKYGKRYEAGLYRLARTWMYVNRGIGLEGGSAPRVRFCARPENTVVEIESKPAD